MFGSCEERTDWSLDGTDSGILVVDGSISNERTNHLVKLSLSNQFSNEGLQPATGATVIITDGQDNVPLTEIPAGSGFYYTPIFQAVIDKQYILYIAYQGAEYFAADQAEPVEPLTPIKIFPVTDTTRVIVPQGTSQRSLTKYIMSWSHTPYCQPADTCFAKYNFYDLQTVDVNELFKPNKDPVLFPPTTIIVRKKYSLSQLYREYLRSVLSETEWRGSSFDVQPGNIESNVSNGALGFFSVSMVDSDTTISF